MHFVPAVLAALSVLAAAGVASAHDSFIVPVKPRDANPLVLQMTSSSFFPEPESPIRPARVARQIARIGATDLTTTLAPGEVALQIQVGFPVIIDGNRTGIVVAMDLLPFDIDVGADEVTHYMDEIGAPDDVRAAVAEAVSRDGVLRETYTKHLKTLTCLGECRGDDIRRPAGSALEFVGTDGGAVLLENGRPGAGRAVFLTTLTAGRIGLITDADGRVSLPDNMDGPVFLSAVILTPPAAQGDRFTSEWASLTFDAGVMGR